MISDLDHSLDSSLIVYNHIQESSILLKSRILGPRSLHRCLRPRHDLQYLGEREREKERERERVRERERERVCVRERMLKGVCGWDTEGGKERGNEEGRQIEAERERQSK